MSYSQTDANPLVWMGTPSLPLEFTIPQNIGSYDGTTDPDDHLFVFTKTLGVYNSLSENMLGQLFSITLRGTARMRFISLPMGSIPNFAQLAKSFRTSFLHKVKFQKSFKEIMDMRPQGSQESVKEFVERFNDEIPSIETRERLKNDFDKPVISAFTKGLQPSHYLEDFTERPRPA